MELAHLLFADYEIPLAYFTDGEDAILIAILISSNSGSERHPAW